MFSKIFSVENVSSNNVSTSKFVIFLSELIKLFLLLTTNAYYDLQFFTIIR